MVDIIYSQSEHISSGICVIVYCSGILLASVV